MSQITSLQNAEKHCAKVSVFVATTMVAVRKAQAPVGRGSSTRPASQHVLCCCNWDECYSTGQCRLRRKMYMCNVSPVSPAKADVRKLGRQQSRVWKAHRQHARVLLASQLYRLLITRPAFRLIATALPGDGVQCSPTMADTKMDSSVHACTVMPAGMGTRKRSATPSPTAAASGTGLAPCSESSTHREMTAPPHAGA